jgi:hypothetical protein
MHGLKGQDLLLNIDLLGGEDIKIMAIVLHNCVFRNITITGNGGHICKRKSGKCIFL